MKIRILGNGGFINSGLPYNSLLIDGTFLIEAPPDLMVSLRRSEVPYTSIRRIFLSHFHGDHYFGMPFFVLNMLNYYLETGRPIEPIELIGPPPLKATLQGLQATATSAHNPSVEFIEKLFRFNEIDARSKVSLGKRRTLVFHQMAHSKPTYGFSILEGESYRLSYLCDTKWNDSFAEILRKKPVLVLCDLNSHPDGKIKEHMTERDILEKALPITGRATNYIGIHLSGITTKDYEKLKFSKPGDEYEF